MTPDVRDLPYRRVRPNPNQPRTEFDPAGLEELARSIAASGLLQPIVVRPEPDGTFQIVMGERRWRAVGLLGHPTIRASVQTMTDDELADAAIVENLQRRDLSPLEEAHAYQRRLDHGLSVDELARRLGLRQAWRITGRTALLKLQPTFQDALRRGILTPSQATEMARHPEPDQRALFDAIGEGRCATYLELRAVSTRLLEQRAQLSLLEGHALKGERRGGERRLAQLVEGLGRTLRLGFEDGQVHIGGDVRPERAQHLAVELAVVEKQVGLLRACLEQRAKGHKKAG